MVQDLLCIYPFSNFEVGSRGSLEETFFSDIIEDVHEVKGGELLLLSLDSLRVPISEVIRRAVAAQVSVIFVKGKEDQKPFFSEVPDQTNGTPILFYQYDFSLQDIEKTLRFIDQLKRIDQFESFVKNSTYHIINEVTETGIEEYLTCLEGRIGRKVMITDLFFKEYFRNRETTIPDSLAVSLRNQFIEKKSKSQCGDFIQIQLKKDSLIYSIFPLSSNQGNSGYLILEGGNVSTFVTYQIKAMIPVIKAEIKKLSQLLQSEKKYQKNFIYDLLHNNFESQYVIMNQARNWGWDLTVPQVLLVMQLKNGSDQFIDSEEADHIEKIIKNTLSALFYQSVTVELDGLFIVMIPFEGVKPKKEIKMESRRIAESIQKKILEYKPGVQVFFGIGRFYHAIIDICRSYQEAKIALELGVDNQGNSFVTHFEDLGMTRLLANVRHELLDEYSNEYLGELEEFDAENETDMLQTLQVYIAENGNLKSTADQLFIHINTLRNRIKKIESILHIDFQNYEDLVNVYISLKIKNMNSRL